MPLKDIFRNLGASSFSFQISAYGISEQKANCGGRDFLRLLQVLPPIQAHFKLCTNIPFQPVM